MTYLQPDGGAGPGTDLSSLFGLTGRTAVVTGGASGLGRAIAEGFAAAGARVVVLDMAAGEALDGSATGSPDITVVRADVRIRDDLERVSADLDRVDVLVNSAGTSARYPAEDFPEDAYQRILDVNLKGSFLTCQVFGRRMLSGGKGSIINLASIGASVAYPGTTAYLQSKGGVAQLTRSLAVEWSSRGVRVNALAPGLFDTPLVRSADVASPGTSDFIMQRTPIGRRGSVAEIVGPALFLASDASSMVTGHLLQVDGGYLAN